MIHTSHVIRSKYDIARLCISCGACDCCAMANLQQPCTRVVTKQKEKPMLGEEEIKNRFGFHKGTIEGDNATLPRHAELRQIFVQMGKLLDERLEDGRAKSVAFTHLQDASMWSHFAIAEGAPLVNETNNLSEHALDELDRNARAYGFEVGRGRVIRPGMKASADNPFLQHDWRNLNKKPEDAKDFPDIADGTDPE